MEPATESHKALQAVSQLKRALIDTSSILYMQKAGYFDLLAGTINLYTIPEVMSEIRSKPKGLSLIRFPGSHALSTDKMLISCALDSNLAMISEDKAILNAMRRAKAPYFNALMMLNLLLLSEKIDDGRYRRFLRALKGIARYSETVWAFGEKVHTAVKLGISSETPVKGSKGI
jgi:hypothetical protein